MLKSGTTAFVDMYDHMDEVAQVVEQAGLRGVLARGVIGLCSEAEQRAKLRTRFGSRGIGTARRTAASAS